MECEKRQWRHWAKVARECVCVLVGGLLNCVRGTTLVLFLPDLISYYWPGYVFFSENFDSGGEEKAREQKSHRFVGSQVVSISHAGS